MDSQTAPIATIDLATRLGQIPIAFVPGKTTFIVGGNGSGKSALVHNMASRLLGDMNIRLTYLPGARPSYFESDSLNMNAYGRLAYEMNRRGWDQAPDTRIRPINGTSRNERAIFDLQAAENQYNADTLSGLKSPVTYAATMAALIKTSHR